MSRPQDRLRVLRRAQTKQEEREALFDLADAIVRLEEMRDHRKERTLRRVDLVRIAKKGR